MDKLTAFHEAGHTTISFLLGEMPETVTIRPDDTSNGHTALLPVMTKSLVHSAMTGTRKWDQKVIEAHLIVLAAGPMAQALHMRQRQTRFIDRQSWATFGGGQDYDVAADLHGEIRKRWPAALRVDDAAEQAHTLLQRPDTWESVDRVAKELVRFKELSYDDLKYLVY